MSNYLMNIPMTKIIQKKEEDNKQSKKKAKSQFKYINVPDIITQAKPSYLNNFIRPINLREISLTPISNSNNIKTIQKKLTNIYGQFFILSYHSISETFIRVISHKNLTRSNSSLLFFKSYFHISVTQFF